MARRYVQVSTEEEEAFCQAARREGLSLSAWLRLAGLSRLAREGRKEKLETLSDLRQFFAECDRRETGDEPSWEEHRKIIEQSIRGIGDA